MKIELFVIISFIFLLPTTVFAQSSYNLYTNSEYGFSIEYPTSHTVYEDEIQDPGIVYFELYHQGTDVSFFSYDDFQPPTDNSMLSFEYS